MTRKKKKSVNTVNQIKIAITKEGKAAIKIIRVEHKRTWMLKVSRHKPQWALKRYTKKF
jgi:hypothetical protein